MQSLWKLFVVQAIQKDVTRRTRRLSITMNKSGRRDESPEIAGPVTMYLARPRCAGRPFVLVVVPPVTLMALRDRGTERRVAKNVT